MLSLSKVQAPGMWMLICELIQQIVPVKTLKKTTETKRNVHSYRIPFEKQVRYIFVLALVS